jgi:hypothetical protein
MRDSDRNALLSVWQSTIDRVGYLGEGTYEATEPITFSTPSGGVMEVATIDSTSLPYNKEFTSSNAIYEITLFATTIGTSVQDVIVSKPPTGGTATSTQDFVLKITSLSMTIDY